MPVGRKKKISLVEHVDREIAARRAEHAQAVADAARLVEEIERLELAKAAVVDAIGTSPSVNGAKPTRRRKSLAKQVGSSNVDRVLTALTRGGRPMTQSEVARALNINDGTASYAMRALIEQGKVERLGAQRRGARYQVVTGERRTRVRPR